MKHVICSVRDAKSEIFGRPFYAPTTGAAIRAFDDEVNRPDSQDPMHTHSEDFSLWHIGSFEDSDASFEIGTPKLLIQANEVKK